MVQANPNPNPSGYKVTSQQDTSGLDATGRYVPGRMIYFTTGTGTPGSVFVPMTQFTEANVRALITAQATILDAVDALDTTG